MHSSGQWEACLILGREFYWVAISEFTMENCASFLSSYCDVCVSELANICVVTEYRPC